MMITQKIPNPCNLWKRVTCRLRTGRLEREWGLRNALTSRVDRDVLGGP
jgi:hypothetical protein